MEILTVEGLGFAYPQSNKKAVDNVSFGVEKGDFITVCGKTGSGKSTLLRLLKQELVPKGDLTGTVKYNKIPLNNLDDIQSASKVGFVMQNPEHQIVTDKVWHELAFGLENLGLPNRVITNRVAEIAGYFGIEDWFEKDVSSLSGGQKQLLNLASVMAMQPEILLLDEPTSRLDPVAASDFLATISKLNRELGLTVIIVEHRLEEVIPVSSKLLVLDEGRLLEYNETRLAVEKAKEIPELLEGMPAAVRLFSRFDDFKATPFPLTVREGRRFIDDNFKNNIKNLPQREYHPSGIAALEFSNVYFRYSRHTPDVLCGLDLTVYEGEIYCLLGGNGSGKTTSLNVAAGLLTPYSGNVKVFGKKIKEYKNQSLYKNCLALLPQDVQTVFLKNTVREELSDAGVIIENLPFDLSGLYDSHPYDLSGGQQQLVALAKAFAANPKLLLLDEPTQGLDAYTKQKLAGIINTLSRFGVAVVIVTHDTEFAARVAHRCGMFFRGKIVSAGVPEEFFGQNSFYTTPVSRMTRGIFENAVTVDDAERLCRQNGRK
ncbi:MAG: ABC transporter ATP-binding protein [Eubacteriales bacterium]|jgi:energy-coupling factor transporter ATP-binding protein EcfA2